MSLLLVGAGGHARAVAETLAAMRYPVGYYVDPHRSDWLDAQYLASDDETKGLPADDFVLGIGGMSPDDLSRRHKLFRSYCERGWKARTVIHPSAVISTTAKIGDGCTILACTVVQPAVRLGEAVIINTGAIVEHDSCVGHGSHLAPGAIVLGGCTIGAACMIGAGALVLPGVTVPDGMLVAAGTRYPK